MNLYSVFIIMWFWNILGYIIWIPFVLFVGLLVIYCIAYVLGKLFSWLKDIVKYPSYYFGEIKKRIIKNKNEIILCVILYLIVGTIGAFIIW